MNNDKSLVIYSKITSSNLSDVSKNTLPMIALSNTSTDVLIGILPITTIISHMISKSKPVNLSSSVTALNITTNITVGIKNALVQASHIILMTLKID